MNKIKVLFVCIHNSARSQMAEAFLNDYGKDKYIAESAGIEPGNLNPFVIKVMSEAGYDISNNKTKSVFDLFKLNNNYDYIVTVCDPEAAEKCPVFPGIIKMIHWEFKDPSSFNGTDEEKLAFTRKVRDEINVRIRSFVDGTV